MKGRILLVDDELDVLELVKNRLEANDYQVSTANDGEEALHKAKVEKPDLIVLDVMMPVINGYEVCARLKQDKELCQIPVLILTAKIKYADKRIAETCGADGYIPKPYSSEILLDEINKFLQD